MSAVQPSKPFACDLCSQTFQTRQGLKVHCTKPDHRRRQLAAESAEEVQREVETSGPSHSQGHGHEPAGFEDQHGVDQSPEPEDNTTETSPGEAARFQTITPVDYRQPVVLNYRRTPTSLPVPAAVAPLVPLLLNLSGDDRNLLLKVIKHQDFSSQLVPWKSADQLHSFLDKNSSWERIVVHAEVLPESESPTQFFAWVRKDNDLLLKELLDSPQVVVYETTSN
ncbi:TPA: hypothetical protein ACH3X1_004880 [Trebouxia sp. C0004]